MTTNSLNKEKISNQNKEVQLNFIHHNTRIAHINIGMYVTTVKLHKIPTILFLVWLLCLLAYQPF